MKLMGRRRNSVHGDVLHAHAHTHKHARARIRTQANAHTLTHRHTFQVPEHIIGGDDSLPGADVAEETP